MGYLHDTRELLIGAGLGLLGAVALSACWSHNCSAQERDLHDLRDASSRAYRYGFDVSRAPFHDDGALDVGSLELDRQAGEVTIRYPIPGGEKVEIWAFDQIVRRGSDDPGT